MFFSALFRRFSRHFRLSGVEAGGTFPCLPRPGGEAYTLFAFFLHFFRTFSALFWHPGETLFLHFFRTFSVRGIYRA